jgi:hypothetical protein
LAPRSSSVPHRIATSPALWLTLIFSLLTVALTWPVARVLASGVPGDYGDPLFIAWVMSWVADRVTAALTNPLALRGFWDAPIFHPETGALAFSEHFIPQTVLILPVYWLTHNPILSYNIAFLTSYVLTGLGTALLTRALSGSLAAAVLAGVVAAFNEYRLVWEVAHLQTLSIYWFPFVLYGIDRYFATGRRHGLVLAGLSWTALNLSSVYYLAYCAPFIVAFVVIELLRYQRVRDVRTWRDLIVAGVAVAAITLPFLLPYAAMQQRMGFARTPLEVITHSATLDNYRVALPRLVVPLAFGGLALLTSLIDAIRRRLDRYTARNENFVPVVRPYSGPRRAERAKKILSNQPRALMGHQGQSSWLVPDATPGSPGGATVASLALLTVAAVWLSLGPVIQAGGQPSGWPALYPLVAPLPGYSGLRVPARLASIFLVLLGVVAGLGAAAMARWSRPLGATLAAIAAAVFLWQGRDQRIPLDQPLPSAGLGRAPAYLTPSRHLPPIYQAVSQLPPDAVLVEFPFGDQWYDVRYMFFAAGHQRPLLNGYSGVFPASYRARQNTLWRPPRDPARARESLKGATHAVVHMDAWPDGYGAQVRSFLEAEGARLIGEFDGARLYELPQ